MQSDKPAEPATVGGNIVGTLKSEVIGRIKTPKKYRNHRIPKLTIKKPSNPVCSITSQSSPKLALLAIVIGGYSPMVYGCAIPDIRSHKLPLNSSPHRNHPAKQ